MEIDESGGVRAFVTQLRWRASSTLDGSGQVYARFAYELHANVLPMVFDVDAFNTVAHAYLGCNFTPDEFVFHEMSHMIDIALRHDNLTEDEAERSAYQRRGVVSAAAWAGSVPPGANPYAH